MKCAGCGREMKDGDLCIKGTPGEFLGLSDNHAVDDLVTMVLGGGEKTDVLVFCTVCTLHGGSFEVEIYHESQR